ncbi:MAG TPA: hypothetical protein VK338_01815, partial [Candidatus Nitrosocosmicus sp.]|nr:hypothetical protein [Candidatus Nitrosocosmicus sp.]
IIKLCFLMEKQYIPYIKWLGSAFSRLKSAVELYPLLMKVQETNSWTRREKVLGEVYSLIAHRHNELDITKKMHTVVTKGARPYKIIKAEEFSKEIYKNLKPPLSNLKYKIGAIDQFVSHTRINHMNYVYNEFREILSKIED